MEETTQQTQPERYIHVILMAQDEMGQLKTVLDGRLTSVKIDRSEDGTGHIYGDFASEVPRTQIEKALEEYKGKLQEEQAASTEETKPAPKKKGRKKAEA
jgi:hypothetical protein